MRLFGTIRSKSGRQSSLDKTPRSIPVDAAHAPPLHPTQSTNTQAGKLAEAVELLMGVEKQARMGNDVPSLKEVCLFTVRLVRYAVVSCPDVLTHGRLPRSINRSIDPGFFIASWIAL